jgi:hypothetical protein
VPLAGQRLPSRSPTSSKFVMCMLPASWCLMARNVISVAFLASTMTPEAEVRNGSSPACALRSGLVDTEQRLAA